MKEFWKDIVGYEGLYQVSNLRNVRSVDRLVNGKLGSKILKKGKIIKQQKDRYGYLKVQLCKNNQKKFIFVHRLVAEAFVPNPNNLPQVNHKDEDKTNNVWTNLEWVDAKTNINYGTRNERVSEKLTNGKRSKPVILTTKHGIYLHKWPSTMAVERETGISHRNVNNWCNNIYSPRNSCFIWKYG